MHGQKNINLFNLLKPCDYFTNQQFWHSEIPRGAHVVYGRQNKQRLLPYTLLTDWFRVTEVESVYSAVRTESFYKTHVSSLKINDAVSGLYMVSVEMEGMYVEGGGRDAM